jgi:glutathione reductase (NADPH)
VSESFDLVVLGSGEAGGPPAIKCRKAGWSVAVVDDQPFGGTCALRGCDPKKVLVGAAALVEWQRRMRGSGIAGDSSIDWPALMAFKKTFTDSRPANREAALTSAGIAVLHGEARFVADDRVAVGDRELRVGHVVLANGASPRALGIPGDEHVITSTQFLELDQMPRRLAFVGAGYVSFEFAHVARAAGAEVIMFGRGRALRLFDETLVGRLLVHSCARGIVVELDTEVVAIERPPGTGEFRVVTICRGSRQTHDVDLVVHGAGRVPNTAHLDAGTGGIQLDDRDGVVVNEYLQSVTNPRVYAAGDVTLPSGKLPLTPVAAHEGAIVASNLLSGNSKRPDYRAIPSVVFSVPPLAAVGLTEVAARQAGLDVRVKCDDTTTWYSNRRVRGSVGMYKTIVDKATDSIVGAHLLGEGADEVINLFALAIRFGISATDLRHTIHAYPTSGSDISYMI